jgi:hypothetical protein
MTGLPAGEFFPKMANVAVAAAPLKHEAPSAWTLQLYFS